MSYEFVVPKECHGLRADQVLHQLLPEFSRTLLSSLIKKNDVLVNGRIIKPKDKLSFSDLVTITKDVKYTSNTESLIAQDIKLNIIYEDEWVIIINKPANLVVHPGAGNPDNTLANALLHHDNNLSSLPRAGIIHRIDKDTTGLLIIAKNAEMYQFLIEAMQKREIKRQYLALVQGQIINGNTIKTYFGRHPKNRIKMSVLSSGKEAVTHYSVLKNYPNQTLLQINLETGRTHQIRVHMAYIKHSIIGDPLYGQSLEPYNTLTRQLLHAEQITFYHPFLKKQLTFTAPIPDDFANILKALDEI